VHDGVELRADAGREVVAAALVSGRYTTPMARSSSGWSSSVRRPASGSRANRFSPSAWNSASQLPSRPGRTAISWPGSSQSSAARTLPS
jgi:hypothetical protein